MGTYITTTCEVHGPDGWESNERDIFTNDPKWPGQEPGEFTDTPFFWQNYSMFALFANVRNEQGITPIAEPRFLPEDVTDDTLDTLFGPVIQSGWVTPPKPETLSDRLIDRMGDEIGSISWVTLTELLAVDYDAVIPSSSLGEAPQTLRIELGPRYFEHLAQLSNLGDPATVRVFFGFKS